jgi:hypothetical protein
MAPILVVVLALTAVIAAAGLMILARIARGIGDLKDRMDDLKVRLGVLDPGDTRVNPFASQAYNSQTKSTPPPDAPEETLPGNG